ncbi:transposable element Tcb1 transposase [Trichonephila clavipes]|nr:transposable element Tcb1 transposase [Trichonephila clavipes]
MCSNQFYFCLQHHDGQIRVLRHRGERLLNCCVTHRHTIPAPGIKVCGGIGFHCHTPLVCITGTLDSQRYISKMLEPVVHSYLQRWPSAICRQDHARPHVARNVQGFFFTHQIELLARRASSLGLPPIENVWSMLAQGLAWYTHPTATQDKLWQYVEATWIAVPKDTFKPLRYYGEACGSGYSQQWRIH